MCHELQVEDPFEEPSQLQEGRGALGLAADSPWSPQSWHSRAHGYRTRGAAVERSVVILPVRRAPHGQDLVAVAHEGFLHAVQLQALPSSASTVLGRIGFVDRRET